jgi:hypothetical protein
MSVQCCCSHGPKCVESAYLLQAREMGVYIYTYILITYGIRLHPRHVRLSVLSTFDACHMLFAGT